MLSENLSKLTVKLLSEHSRSLTRKELVNLLRYKEDLSPSMYSELYKIRVFLFKQVKAKRMNSWGKFYYLTDEGQQYFLGDA
jgi:transcription initiation factor IIE alpha subunit